MTSTKHAEGLAEREQHNQNPDIPPYIEQDDPDTPYLDRTGTPPPSYNYESDGETEASSAMPDDGAFAPTKAFWIQSHLMATRVIKTIDITSLVPMDMALKQGKETISDEFRAQAKNIGEKEDAKPVFTFRKKHWYNKSYNCFDCDGEGENKTPVAEWKHPTFSMGTAILTFPSSPSSPGLHQIEITPLSWTRRTNTFVLDSMLYTWRCDLKRKSNRMTLSRKIAGKETMIARYMQDWSLWGLGGVLLVDEKEVGGLVAVLTACTMLRRMEQRRWERY